jgi:hypothetical protein
MIQRFGRRIVGLALAVGTFMAVYLGQSDQGIARDETVYMSAGARYAQWWLDLVERADGIASRERIASHFGGPGATANNREHPPLMKTLFGLSETLFFRKLGWTSRVTAARLPTAIVHALLITMVFLFASSVWGLGAGALGATLLLLMPRLLFHAGLAAFDAPMVALWFATLVAYYRALDSGAWVIGLGVCFGLALATKHNAILVPAVLLPHLIWVSVWSRRRGQPIRAIRIASIVGALAVLGPLVLIGVWPWLWFDTLGHLGDWMRFHFAHVHYNFEYLGKNWNAPPFPWHVAIVTTVFTVPVATLAAAAWGAMTHAGAALRGPSSETHRGPALLLLLSAAVAMGPFFLRSTPIFGAEKHWATAMPTICIFAGIGAVAAARMLVQLLFRMHAMTERTQRTVAQGVGIGLGALIVLAAAAETVASRPYALSHYNALAGGAAGGADLGMNRQFWGVAARGVLPFLDEHAPGEGKPPVKVYAHDASPAWPLYVSEGLLSPRLPHAGQEKQGIDASQIAIVVHERHFNRHDYMIWTAYGTVKPEFVLTHQGVPLVSVYVRP